MHIVEMERAQKYILIRKTVSVSVLLAVVYGLVQDQITIRICPEYFTVWHPNPLDIQNLTILALYWGVVATWWMGLILGLIVSAAATVGTYPLPTFTSVRRKLLWVIVFAACCTVLFGVVARLWGITVPGFIEHPGIAGLSFAKRRDFAVDLLAHEAAYDSSAVGALVAALLIFLQRKRTERVH